MVDFGRATDPAVRFHGATALAGTAEGAAPLHRNADMLGAMRKENLITTRIENNCMCPAIGCVVTKYYHRALYAAGVQWSLGRRDLQAAQIVTSGHLAVKRTCTIAAEFGEFGRPSMAAVA